MSIGLQSRAEAVKGGKLTDNVLRGTWSLMCNEVGDPVVSTRVDTLPFPQARATERISLEFTASADADTTWIGIEKLGGGRQANLTIDDLRLEDLGTAG